jgi:hypothetical protein
MVLSRCAWRNFRPFHLGGLFLMGPHPSAHSHHAAALKAIRQSLDTGDGALHVRHSAVPAGVSAGHVKKPDLLCM